MLDSELPILSVEELDKLCETSIDEIQADIEAYEERVAIRSELVDDGLTTDQRAVAALKRSERFKGEHDVAKAWLRASPTARIWARNGHTS